MIPRLLPLALFLAAAPAWTQDSAWSGIRGVLERQEPFDERDPSDVARELVALGPEVAPLLLRMHAGEVAQVTGEGGTPTSLQVPPDRLRHVALAALSGLPPQAVVDVLEPLAIPAAPLEQRLACVRVLGALRAEEGVPLWIDLATSLDSLEMRYRTVRTSLTDALAAILTEAPASWKALARAVPGLDEDRAGLVLEAVLSADHPRGVDLLAGWADDLELPPPGLLARLGEVYARSPWRLPPEELDLQRFHEARSTELRREAAVCAARTRRLQSVPALIDALEDPEPAVARSADWALRELSGTVVQPDAAGWRAWFREEQVFWRTRGRHLAEGLADAPREDFATGLRTLREHPLFRDDTARLLAEALPEMPPERAQLVCRALEDMGSRAAVPALVSVLESSAPRAGRIAALHTLRRLTGRNLPPDVHEWRRLLGS